MCGIAGSIGLRPLSPARRISCQALMRRRGPDGEGHLVKKCGRYHLDLLHSRLSIIDLDARSAQPLERQGLALVFNGEIYNYPELKKRLIEAGHRFSTAGDGEVILAAYQQWGVNCVKYFNGMWAFALYDEAMGQVFFSRDRFGEKPLYFWQRDGRLFFGSEVKFLAGMCGSKPDINMNQIKRFLVNGYKSLFRRPESFFQDIIALPAGCNAVVDAPHMPKATPYWQLRYTPQPMGLAEAREEATERVARAIELRLRADVPVALRLSGGIDSNVALGIATGHFNRDITTFSVIEEDPRYDETAAILSSIRHIGCDHELIEIPRQGFWQRLSGLIDYFGTPMMTISYYLHALASERIHEKGFKVSLGGTGADELFSGYYDHYLFWLAEMRDRPDFKALCQGWQKTYGRFVRNPHLQDPEIFIKTPDARQHIFLRNEEFSTYLQDGFCESHIETKYCDEILRNRMLNELMDETVPVMLHEDDLCAMAFSVENRATYLDHELAEFLFTVPSEHLFHDHLPKHLLRNAGAGFVRPEILENPRKQGINAPVTALVDFTDHEMRDRLMSKGPLFDILKRDKLERLLRSDLKMNSESKFLFSVVSTRMFLDTQLNFNPRDV